MSWLLGVLIAAALFGVVASYFRRRTTTSARPWREGARVEREVFVRGDVSSVVARVREALDGVGKLRDAAEGSTIEAVTASTWRSSGTVVRADVRPNRDGTVVKLTAWPGAQLFDWGASRRAVDAVADRLG